MPTDIDRLHRVVQSNYGPEDRGVGKTYAHCHELCGTLAVGDCSIVICRVERLDRMDHILPMLEKVFSEHDIWFEHRISRTCFRVNVHGRVKQVRFVTFRDEQALDGMECNIVDFND